MGGWEGKKGGDEGVNESWGEEREGGGREEGWTEGRRGPGEIEGGREREEMGGKEGGCEREVVGRLVPHTQVVSHTVSE